MTKGRGAKAPRPAFRAKATPKAKAKTTAKARTKTKAKATPKRAAARVETIAARTTKDARPVETLGTITCPSGALGIFDIGLVGYLPRPALEPAIVKVTVPIDRELVVTGTRLGHGRFADCWDHVSIVLAAGNIQSSRKLGEAGVDFARLACLDLAVLDQWRHEDSLDGLADVVFWGRDEGLLAKVMNAPRSREGHGWSNLPVAEAEAKADEAARRKAANKWLLNIDYRPHSHHYQALAAARANPNGAGTLELGGARMLLFFTSWGDGVFPIFLDLDAEDRPVRVRIQLASAESNAAMTDVNG